MGYTYNPSSTPPLTQTNVMGPFGVQYPVTDYGVQSGTVYGVTTCSATTPCVAHTGGLVVPIKNVWKVANGYTGRRVVVDNAKCDACHARIGAKPTFHAGQRNDAPTCSFCHTANQGSGGWSANASTFVHGIHAAEKRSVKYAWEGGCNIGSTFQPIGTPPGQYWYYGDCIDNSSAAYDATKIVAPRFYYPEVTYPGLLSCDECHTAGFFAKTEAVASKLLWTTYAKGATAPAYPKGGNTAYPYVDPTAAYGTPWAFSSTTGATTLRGTQNLVGTPVTAACFSCHDTTANQAHYTAFGGKVYSAAGATSLPANPEQCITCHGTGAGLDLAKVHP